MGNWNEYTFLFWLDCKDKMKSEKRNVKIKVSFDDEWKLVFMMWNNNNIISVYWNEQPKYANVMQYDVMHYPRRAKESCEE